MTVPRADLSLFRTSLAVTMTAMAIVTGCSTGTTISPSPSAGASAAHTPRATRSDAPGASSSAAAPAGSVAIVGQIVTMDEPPIAEALLIERGVVVAVGTRDEVLARAGDSVPVIDLGQNVAYPGFIDAHAHWIGDREYYGLESPAEAMDAAIRRGWTSISEQWVDRERLAELEALAADGSLPLRVDAYLALNGLNVGDYYGDWYEERQPGPVDDHLRVQGVKIHLDSGTGATLYWEPAELTATIGRANAAGWQVSVHAVSTEAQDLVLNAFEAAIGPTGANPLHHRIEHALQVTDNQLARIVNLDLGLGIQLDGAAVDWVLWAASQEGESGRDYQSEDVSLLARWRDFVDAGLHVAGTSDAPWFFPDLALSDDIGRPVDQIAGGLDRRPREFPDVPEWTIDQLLTAEQGLRAVTVDAAHALGDETRRGHLAAAHSATSRSCRATSPVPPPTRSGHSMSSPRS